MLGLNLRSIRNELPNTNERNFFFLQVEGGTKLRGIIVGCRTLSASSGRRKRSQVGWVRIHGKDARREGKYFECMVGGACTVVGKKKKKELDLFARNNIVTN